MSAAEYPRVPVRAGAIPASGQPAHLQAPVLITPAEPVTVAVDVADALTVGSTLVALAKGNRLPREVLESLARVGKQLRSAARAAAGSVGR